MEKDDRRMQHDFDDWLQFFSEQWLHRCKDADRGTYLPSPAELAENCRIVRWLESIGVPHDVIANIMQHENPEVRRARQMFARHGVREAVRRIRLFALPTEYDTKGGSQT